MKNKKDKISITLLTAFTLLICGCSSPTNLEDNSTMELETKPKVEGVDFFLPKIDLNNWKVTLPIDNPTEVLPPDILNYGTNSTLKKYMYNDSTDGSLVFYTYPGSTTPNASNSRTELREQMTAGSNHDNWTFKESGSIKGELRVSDITKDQDGKFHRTIIMQIHGRLTNEQRDLLGEDDNNAPPVLKIYWNDNRVRVHRKVLKDLDIDDLEILKTNAWTDEAFWFDTIVGFEKFKLEVIASDGKLEVKLNDSENMVFDDIHTEKWSVFENYFKAGNYLQTRDDGAYSKVNYYSLEVKH